jgi:hypothetical protein
MSKLCGNMLPAPSGSKSLHSVHGPVYDNEKENWRILTDKEVYATVKKPTITETIRLHRLHLFGYVQRMEENRIPKRVLYMNLGTTRPRNRWQDEVREDGRIVGEKSGCKKHVTGMEEAPENSKESSHFAHVNGMNDLNV